MLMRTDPFRDLDRLGQRHFDQETSEVRPMVVPMDAYRDGDQFVVQLDLPGVEPSAIEVNVQHNFLTVRAERGSAHPRGRELPDRRAGQGPGGP